MQYLFKTREQIVILHAQFIYYKGINYYIVCTIYLKRGNKIFDQQHDLLKPSEQISKLCAQFLFSPLHVMCRAP